MIPHRTGASGFGPHVLRFESLMGDCAVASCADFGLAGREFRHAKGARKEKADRATGPPESAQTLSRLHPSASNTRASAALANPQTRSALRVFLIIWIDPNTTP
jgi:hypothetical protein